jgi:hypothetical protein
MHKALYYLQIQVFTGSLGSMCPLYIRGKYCVKMHVFLQINFMYSSFLLGHYIDIFEMSNGNLYVSLN